jgi:hypothetical protein
MMIDMNMSIENIMNECDYIAEVKGEAEAGYETGRHYAKLTHDHGYGKDAGAMEKMARSKGSDEPGTRRPMKTSLDYERRRNRVDNQYNTKGKGNFHKSVDRATRKTANESMIDMNMSIVNIMSECDYIAEVKGEAELAYSNARGAEKGTHDHDYGKYYSKTARSSIMDGRNGNGPMKNKDDYAYRSSLAAHEKMMQDKREARYDRKRDKKKAANESSIFDDLLNLV